MQVDLGDGGCAYLLVSWLHRLDHLRSIEFAWLVQATFAEKSRTAYFAPASIAASWIRSSARFKTCKIAYDQCFLFRARPAFELPFAF